MTLIIIILTIKDSVNVQISFQFACFSKGNGLWLLTTYAHAILCQNHLVLCFQNM